MARKKYLVELTAAERQTLEHLVHKGKSSARKLTRARILLKADEGLEDEAIAEAVGTSVATSERRRHRFVERNLEALNELPRPGGQPKLSGKQEAPLIAVACTPAPRGRVRWALALVAEQVVELGVTDSIARETVRQVLNPPLKPWRHKQWCLPKVSGEFVAAREDVLDLYAEPYNPKRPTVTCDETSKQLIGETRQPLPAQPGRPARYDYEYQRNGTRNLFLFCEPQAGWRHVVVTAQRTMTDFAHQMKWLVEERYPEAEVIRVVLDTLNTHKPGALYETFSATEAHRLRQKLEFHYTPKHGS